MECAALAHDEGRVQLTHHEVHNLKHRLKLSVPIDIDEYLVEGARCPLGLSTTHRDRPVPERLRHAGL